MLDIRTLIKVLGGFSIIFGGILLLPGIYTLLDGSTVVGVKNVAHAFIVPSAIIISTGTMLWFSQRHYHKDLNIRTAFGIVVACWMLACCIGALPYLYSHTITSIPDALFESTSGFTGTGATIFSSVEEIEPAILLWRSMTQWLGGMGIIVFFLALLPILGVGSVQLFRAEVTGPNKDPVTPRVREAAQSLWKLYTLYTVVIIGAYHLIGEMSLFDSLNHAFTTVSTGGFSTKNAGIAAFNSPVIDYMSSFFMIVVSINFALHFRLFYQGDWRVVRDTELKSYISILTIAVLLLTYMNWGSVYDSLEPAFRNSLFVVAATGSSAGYTHADYTTWPVATHFILLFLMAMGASSGSTGGGIKCVRIVTAVRHMASELKRILHPNAVLHVKINGSALPKKTCDSIWGFFFLYFFIFFIATLGLTVYSVDLLSAASAAISALSNIGPALGSFGPYDNYSALPLGAKSILVACMLLGRLEIFTVLIIATREFWKK